MQLNTLTAISPIDGRYFSQVQGLSEYFSEHALIRYRVLVEIEYFIALAELAVPQLTSFNQKDFEQLRNIYKNFTEAEAQNIKDIEKTINHDVKAVEYFLKEKFKRLGFTGHAEFIHFGLTSQDINNTAIPLSIKEAVRQQYIPLLDEIISKLHSLSEQWKAVPMLARTHGQPASPTLLGKEFYVFVERLNEQKLQLLTIPFTAKFGGATGNMNAHYAAYPQIDWHLFASDFVDKKFGLKRSRYTTQIEHYDNMAALFDCIKRINTILVDLSRDVWQYISMEYFRQQIKESEVGSSAMPHKVNPIDFENAEGNLGIASAILEHLSTKLPVSRLQRDLTDSTVLRNTGVPFAHIQIAFNSILKGLNKIILNDHALQQDLEKNWAVIAEAIQTILRRENYPLPYEKLKELTRKNTHITQNEITSFIESLDVRDEIKKELHAITPFNYTGRFIIK